MDDTEEMDAILSAKKKALDRLRGLSSDALSEKLKRKKKPAPMAVTITMGHVGAPGETAEELDEDDAKRLMQLYEAKQGR